MTPRVKFCGLTRPADAAAAADFGAAYAGVIFAGGPRHINGSRAAEVLAALPASIERVGVFAGQGTAEIAELVAAAGLAVVQLHDARPAAEVAAIRSHIGAKVWAVVRTGRGELPADFAALADAADAVLVDSASADKLGGSGVAADWEALARHLDRHGRPRRLVLAGGLREANVARAIALIAPDVVDVSSGVEAAPGVKDHARMAAFAAAVLMTKQSA